MVTKSNDIHIDIEHLTWRHIATYMEPYVIFCSFRTIIGHDEVEINCLPEN